MAKLCFVVGIMLGQAPLVLAQDEAEKIYKISRVSESAGARLGSSILTIVYNRAGLKVEFVDFTGKRALIQANAGVTDGEAMRIKGLSKNFPNLIPVPTSFMTLNGRLYTIHIQRDIKGLSDLTGLNMGIVRGIIVAEKITKEHPNRIFASSANVMFKQLVQEKIDVALSADIAGGVEILENFPDENIHVVGPPIFQVELQHYLHKKNAHLVPIIDSTIKAMKQSGELDRVYTILFSKLLKRSAEQ